MQIHTYAKQGNIQEIAEEIASGIDHVDNNNSRTSLMYAVTSENVGIDIVQFLVEHGADVNAVESEFQEPVLGLAVNSVNLTKIRFILDSGANINYQIPHGYDFIPHFASCIILLMNFIQIHCH